LSVRKSSAFFTDYGRIARWYVREADEKLAQRWLDALDATLEKLSSMPEMGRLRRFRHHDLQGLRSFVVARPFHRHVLFYRVEPREIIFERVIHGSRDLPRRLLQSAADE